jgi:mono/diheme cytochrome c family protein
VKSIQQFAFGNAEGRTKYRASRLAAGILGASLFFPLAVGAQTPPLPDAPGKDVVLQNCAGCHDLNLISTQRKTPAEWEATVNRMVANGVTLDENQFDQVVAYLGENLAKPAPATAAAAPVAGAQASATAKQVSAH